MLPGVQLEMFDTIKTAELKYGQLFPVEGSVAPEDIQELEMSAWKPLYDPSAVWAGPAGMWFMMNC